VIIAIPTIAPEERDQLLDLRKSVRRVHKSVHANSPVRRNSADLSASLERLHRRGIPLYDLAEVVGLSHQAVRVRVRAAAQAADSPPRSPTKGVPSLKSPTKGVVLVADAGVHRRLHVFDPPDEAGPAYLAMIPSIPLLEERDLIVTWLESESDSPPLTTSSASTRLRDPAAVYLPREMLSSVLVPLTTEENDAERVAAEA
jgi:hypothetical protein